MDVTEVVLVGLFGQDANSARSVLLRETLRDQCWKFCMS